MGASMSRSNAEVKKAKRDWKEKTRHLKQNGLTAADFNPEEKNALHAKMNSTLSTLDKTPDNVYQPNEDFYIINYYDNTLKLGNPTRIHCALALGDLHENCYLGNKCPIGKFTDCQDDLLLRAYGALLSAYAAYNESPKKWEIYMHETHSLFAAWNSNDLCWMHCALNTYGPGMIHVCDLGRNCPLEKSS